MVTMDLTYQKHQKDRFYQDSDEENEVAKLSYGYK